MKKKHTRYCGVGGQAVLEGVMMKNKDAYAVAIRKPDGTIEVDTEEFQGVMHGSVWKRIPFIRGVFQFADSMILGMRALMWSASFYEEEESQEERRTGWFERLFGDRAESVAMGLTTTVSLVLAVAIFMVLPYLISALFGRYIRNASLIAIIEGLIRIVIFVAYIAAISAMRDIRRLYQYHGAEHKCINCIERGRPLTVPNVMRSSRQHKRCGTSFLLFVMLVSVVLFFFIRVSHPVWRVVIRILLIPVIAGISYELIRLAGRSDNLLVRILSAPGMWLQRLTTKEPDETMAEVAIAAVEAVFDWKAYLKDTFGYEIDEPEDGTEADEPAKDKLPEEPIEELTEDELPESEPEADEMTEDELDGTKKREAEAESASADADR